MTKKSFTIFLSLFFLLITYFLPTSSLATPGDCEVKNWEDYCVAPQVFCDPNEYEIARDLMDQYLRLCCEPTASDPMAEQLCEDYTMPEPAPEGCPYCYNPETHSCTQPGSLPCTDTEYPECCTIPPVQKPPPGAVCEEHTGYMCLDDQAACESYSGTPAPELKCPTNAPFCCYIGTGLTPVPQATIGPVQTAIGPIDVSSPEAFVNKILTFALGIGGGIAVLLIIIGGVQVLTSAGNPERAKAGKELITSAVSGLLLIVFAVFLLKLIGKDILKIPGFGP